MIPIRNVYYMLSYAFQVLNEQGYKNIATEQFDNTAELCAAILTKGIAFLLKRGLGKEYIPQVETLSTLRGKVEVTDSVKGRTMQSDITLSNGNDVLIIDAKYYPASGNTQVQYDKHTLHSGNLYQIFTYVKNKDAEFGETPHKVSGMLLYAKTEEDIQPDNSYRMSGNEISVKTLDLNMEFAAIAEKLNTIVKERFGLVAI